MESNSECSRKTKVAKIQRELDADDTEEVKDPSPSKEKYDKYMQELVANDTEEVKAPRPSTSSDTKFDKLTQELEEVKGPSTRSNETIMPELHDLFREPINDSLKNLKEVEKEDYAAQNQECAEAAISFLNASCKNAEGGTEYELVEPVSSLPFMTTSSQLYYHANFKAKSKNDPEAKPELFFVELVRKEQGDTQVKLCTSLGPSDSESAATGLNGCGVCSNIHHPTSGRFVVSGCRPFPVLRG